MSINHSARGPLVERYEIFFRDCCEAEIIRNSKHFYVMIVDGRVHTLTSTLGGVEWSASRPSRRKIPLFVQTRYATGPVLAFWRR